MGKENVEVDKILKLLFTEGKGEDYLEVVNSVGQRWLIPAEHIRTGLSLYHASRIRGKAVKRLLPLIGHFPVLLNRIGFGSVTLSLSSCLRELLTEVFGKEELTFAVFCGTLGVHRKITLQISYGGRVAGYCKISDRKAVRDLFKRESKLLDDLRRQGVPQVPQTLFHGELFSGIGMFIQDTALKERPLRGMADERLIWDFLQELHTKTALDIPFGQSDYYRALQGLKRSLAVYGIEESALLERVSAEVEDYFQNNATRFSVYHGDLTPWNGFVCRGRLYAFDWEYAEQSFPPFLDFFHFFTQTALIERRWKSRKIYREFCSMHTAVEKYVPAPSLYYKAYLLSIIRFYLDREQGNISFSLQSNYRCWIDLLIALDKNSNE